MRWEQRIRRRGRPPLLDVSLLRELPGYGNGLAVGALYFTGFTGVFLVLSVFLQEGLDLSPLHAGLLLTPFAMGSAVTAPIAGRIVSAIGRRVTVIALSVMMTGVLLVAVLVPLVGTDRLGWVLVPALVLAGLGGGGVVNPNFTLALAEVPPHMGGAAGAAIQTGQRIGSAIGAALLMTVYEVVQGSGSASRGLQAALLTALVVLAAAQVMAVRALREQNPDPSRTMRYVDDDCPEPISLRPTPDLSCASSQPTAPSGRARAAGAGARGSRPGCTPRPRGAARRPRPPADRPPGSGRRRRR